VCQAVIVNSGNANCCTGDQGAQDAAAMARCVAAGLSIPETSVLVASTGVIGQRLPIEKVQSAVPALLKQLSPDGFEDFARAIMTTDTVPKLVARRGQFDGQPFSLIAAAKGSGMIRPDMATLLGFAVTDLALPHDFLQQALLGATQRSFNRITVDGDTSTNDTVLLLANGLSGVTVDTPARRDQFQALLDDTLTQLARMLVKDGEGATKLVEIVVRGALSDTDARAVADTVANSSLVKTAFFGEDANWGRILAAAGRAAVPVEPGKLEILFDDVLMFKDGAGFGDAIEEAATRVLRQSEFAITIDLHLGQGSATVWTCDFSVDYVKINADYRS
jgi:glutamate N-acetyltransferase/amino-acid N-acetyltransferase